MKMQQDGKVRDAFISRLRRLDEYLMRLIELKRFVITWIK